MIPLAIVYQNAIDQQFYQRQTARVLINRGGVLTSSKVSALLIYTVEVLRPYAARVLANDLARFGYKKTSYTIYFLLLLQSVNGFSVGPGGPIN